MAKAKTFISWNVNGLRAVLKKGFAELGPPPQAPRYTTGELLRMATRILGTTFAEAPEVAARLRRRDTKLGKGCAD